MSNIIATPIPPDPQADAALEQHANRCADLEQAGYTFVIDLACPRTCRHGWVLHRDGAMVASSWPQRFATRPEAVNDAWRYHTRGEKQSD